jgi:hypothetical protein
MEVLIWARVCDRKPSTIKDRVLQVLVQAPTGMTAWAVYGALNGAHGKVLIDKALRELQADELVASRPNGGPRRQSRYCCLVDLEVHEEV